MDKSKKLLNFFLGFNSVIQVGLGFTVLLALPFLLNLLGMTYSDDLQVFATFFGICVLILSTSGFITMSMNKNGKEEAIAFAKFIGISLTLGGIIVMVQIPNYYYLGLLDMARGIAIAVFAYRSQK